MASLAERFRHWFDYERDSHAKVFASLESVPEAERTNEAFQRCIDLLAHIAAARELWLFRFGISDTGPSTYDELFPRGESFEDVERRVQAMHEEWGTYLSRLDDEELTRVFVYQSVEGPRFENRIEDLLTQLFGHSWYHRGQIASLVRALGGEPAVTDFVYWSREPI